MPDARPRAALPARFLLPCLFLALGLWFSPLERLGAGLERLPSGFRDSGLAMASLEHGLRWIKGRESSFAALPVFFPAVQAQPLPDLHPATLPLYGLARLLGLERERAFQAWFAGLWSLNFLCAWLALRRAGLGQGAASLGGLLFASAAATPLAVARPALLHAFPLPLAVACATAWSRTRSPRAWAGLCAAMVLQWYGCAELGAGLTLGLSVAGLARLARRGPGGWDFFEAERQAAVALAALACLVPLGLNLMDALPGGLRTGLDRDTAPWLLTPLAACALVFPGLRGLEALLGRAPGQELPGRSRPDAVRTSARPGTLQTGALLAALALAALVAWLAPVREGALLADHAARVDAARRLLAPAATGASALALLTPGDVESVSGQDMATAAMLAAQDLGLPLVNGFAATLPPGFDCFARQDCPGLARWLARVQARSAVPLFDTLGLAGNSRDQGCPLPRPDRRAAREWLARSGQGEEPSDLAWLLDIRGFHPAGDGGWRMEDRGELTLLAGERLTLRWSGGAPAVLRVLVNGRSAGRMEVGGGPGRASFAPGQETRYAFEVESQAGGAVRGGVAFAGLAFSLPGDSRTPAP